MHRAGNLRIGGQQTQVGVNARGGGVVIARTNMRVATCHSIRIPPRQQGQLAMRLQADEPMKNLNSGVLQIARPANIRRFIEARLQLHDRRDFLLRSRRD